MEPLLDLLRKNARETDAELADMLGTTTAAVHEKIADYERQGVIRGYRAVINEDLVSSSDVRAVIELRIRPERSGGFDRIAQRIGQFPQVESLFLMSGGYDLLLFVRGRNLQEVASFVSSELAALEGVLSTATHFMLKTYKDQGTLLENNQHDDRLQVTP
ncbi:MAG: Lrp/AsnC family transcriptional regulator [Kiritimatiellia bacterium]